MKISRAAQLGIVAAVAALALAGCSSDPGTAPSSSPSTANAPKIDASVKGTIAAGGSSAQANAQTAWTAAFTSLAKGVTVNYDKTLGSGGGRTNFLAGSLDFAGSDAPMSADETTSAAAKFPGGAVNLPIYLDGVAVAYNSSIGATLNLTTPTIAKIFSGKITDWSDAAITADNGGKALAAGKINVVVRSDSSGTASNFTNFLHAADPTDWTWAGSGTFPADIKGVDAQKGGGAVATEVSTVPGSIGYLDHSALVKGVSAATVNGIAFSNTAVADALTAGGTTASNGVAGDLSMKFDYAKIKAKSSAYPIPLLSYAIIPLKFTNAGSSAATIEYLKFIATPTGQQVAAAKAGSAPLPQSVLDSVQATLGTVK
ncbi:phosphate ABC transporter substrate-binding protein PstS [Microbacterium capsulatum]|uniref:Phosphate-binding protein n=1 Tax=Microbacterium capsulatum TaxID=3041921 RepID=A0ABU0XIL8_9MICO|nr:phosphate ABC transporter substrate-binding protein PstS [Microbacterium sp. ASV81]MDQ4214413.1 phosphate ABC transporter substrate-binding protein PstS [Microbacterium sp. ASV81]